jgi:hypothetical protein
VGVCCTRFLATVLFFVALDLDLDFAAVVFLAGAAFLAVLVGAGVAFFGADFAPWGLSGKAITRAHSNEKRTILFGACKPQCNRTVLNPRLFGW